MKKIFVLLASIAFCSSLVSATLDLNTPEGEKRLIESNYSNDYWILNSHYVSQQPHSCGSGSAAMVLNALNIYRPHVEEYSGHTLFTPSNFLKEIQDVITQEEIKSGFMSMQVLADSLNVFSLDTSLIHADTITAKDFRNILKENLNNPQVFLIANYYRPFIGHNGKGNFSPIGAFDEASDSILLLDPLRSQHGPFWVEINDLLKSMNEVDASGNTRGLILVKKHHIEIFSENGMQMIKNSQFRGNFFTFSRYFETQAHWTYCAVASSVAVMNTLLNKNLFSQENFFTDEVQKIVTPDAVKTDWRGLTADELTQILSIHGFSASFTSADMFTVDTFRDTIKKALNNPSQFIIANYNRPQINQVGGGHFSPIVAYDQETDSLLIMDTSRYKYPPVWIDLKTFVQSMHTKDSDGFFRGYLTVKKRNE